MANLKANWVPRLLTILLRIVPADRNTYFVHGIPSTEGNAVETVRAIVNLTDASIAWPDAPPDQYLEKIGIMPAARIRRLPPTRSLKSLWRFLRAKAVFTTHGLYGNPTPAGSKPLINLWHGDGFKGGALFPDRSQKGACATYIVSGSELTGRLKADLAKLPQRRVLPVGNPRMSQFKIPLCVDDRVKLGIDPGQPFVLWMPTFRIAQYEPGKIAWSNTSNPQSDKALTTSASSIAAALWKEGIRLVIKPHRLDAVNRDVLGAITLDDKILSRHCIPLYSVIGASAGLISDYSSVWVDYLALDRPIAFLVDDLDDFSESRPIMFPELIADYPGEQIGSEYGLQNFIDDIRSQGLKGKGQRDTFKSTIGYYDSFSGAEDLVRSVLFEKPSFNESDGSDRRPS